MASKVNPEEQPVAEPVTESVAEPVTEPVVEPVASPQLPVKMWAVQQGTFILALYDSEEKAQDMARLNPNYSVHEVNTSTL